LEKLIGPPGFTGNAPGGPSRWSTERSAKNGVPALAPGQAPAAVHPGAGRTKEADLAKLLR
jgi:hypothetical protein